MKEAIKVQSVTITVINGMSGAWVRQKQARSLLRSWLTVKETAKETVCVQEGTGSIALGSSGGVYEEVVPKEGLPARHAPLPIHARCQPRCHPFGLSSTHVLSSTWTQKQNMAQEQVPSGSSFSSLGLHAQDFCPTYLYTIHGPVPLPCIRG